MHGNPYSGEQFDQLTEQVATLTETVDTLMLWAVERAWHDWAERSVAPIPVVFGFSHEARTEVDRLANALANLRIMVEARAGKGGV